MNITYRPADEASAREFLLWQYKPPYDIYNCPPERIEKSIEYNINPANNVYAMLNEEDELISEGLSAGQSVVDQGAFYLKSELLLEQEE